MKILIITKQQKDFYALACLCYPLKFCYCCCSCMSVEEIKKKKNTNILERKQNPFSFLDQIIKAYKKAEKKEKKLTIRKKKTKININEKNKA